MTTIKSNIKAFINQDKNKKIIFNLVFILFAMRVLSLILLEPYIGIANNGDFQRLMLPVGLNYSENVWLNENKSEYFFSYVVNDFIFTKPINCGWHQIFSVFPRLAVLISKIGMQESFDLRFMGMINALFYLSAVYFLFWLIRQIKGTYSYIFMGGGVSGT